MDVTLGFDARPAEAGADRFAAAGERAIQTALRLERAFARIDAAARGVGQAFAGAGGVGTIAQQAEAATAAIGRQGQASAQLQATLLREVQARLQLAAASGQVARADEQWQQRIVGITGRLDAGARAMRLFEREQAKALQQGITYLGTLGGADRAFAQFTQSQIRAATSMGQVVDRASLLAQVQERVRTSGERAAQVFSTQAVNARDLRVNMANLSQQMTLLAGSGGMAVARLTALASVVRQIRTAMAGSSLFGGGAVAGGSGAGGPGGIDAGDIAGAAMLTRGMTALSAATAGVVAGIAGVGVGLAALIPTLARTQIEVERIEGRFRAALGSSEAARQEFAFLADETYRLGISLTESAAGYSRLAAAAKGTALEGQGAREAFLGIATASAALRLSAAETGGVLFAVEQIISKGKLSSEELRRQLGDRLPGAFTIAANAMGVTTAALDEMLRKGQIASEDFIPKFAAALQARFAGEAVEASKGLQAQIERLNQSFFELKAAVADTGVIDFFSGAITRAADAVRQLAVAMGRPWDLNGIDAAIGKAEAFKAAVDAAIKSAQAAGKAATLPEKLPAGLEAVEAERKRLFAAVPDFGSTVNVEDAERALIGLPSQAKRDKAVEFLEDLANKASRSQKALDTLRESVTRLGTSLASRAINQDEFNRGLADAQKIYAESIEKATGAAKAENARAREIANAREAIAGEIQRLNDRAEALETERNARVGVQTQLKLEAIARKAGIDVLREESAAAEAAARRLEDAQRVDLAREIDERVEALRQEALALTVSDRERAISVELLRAEEDARRRGLPLIDGETRLLEEQARKLRDAAAAKFDAQKLQREREEAAKLAQEPFLEASRNIQDSIAGALRGAFDGGVDSAQTAADAILDVFKDLAAELLTLVFFKPEAFGQGGGLSGILGALSAGKPVVAPAATAPFGGTVNVPGVGPVPLTPSAAGGGGSGLTGALGQVTSIGRALASGGLFNPLIPGAVPLGAQGPTQGLASAIPFSGAFTPFSALGGFVGMLGGQALGLGSGNGLLDAGLSSLGSIGGTIGGAALASSFGIAAGSTLGSIVPGIGSAIGALVGLAVSTLFKGLFDEEINFPELQLLTSNDRNAPFSQGFAVTSPFGYVGANAPNTSGGDLDVQSIARFVRGLDETLAEFLTQTQIEGAAGAIQQLPTFQVSELGNKQPEQELFPVVVDRINKVFLGAFGAPAVSRDDALNEYGIPAELFDSLVQRGGAQISEALARIIPEVLGDNGSVTEESAQQFVEAAARILQERQQALAIIDDLLGRAEPPTEAKRAIDAINESWTEFIKNAARLALGEKEIADARNAQVAAIRRVQTGFLETLEDRVLGFTDPRALAEREAERERDRLIREAQDLQLPAAELSQALTNIGTIFAQQMKQIAEQFANDTSSRDGFLRGIDDELLALRDPRAAAVREAERERDEKIRTALGLGLPVEELTKALTTIGLIFAEQMQDIAERFADEAADALNLDGLNGLIDAMFNRAGQSPLDPTVVLGNARAEAFEDFQAGVLGGDDEAFGRLSQSLGNYLDAAEAVYAHGPGYFAVFDQIAAMLQAVEGNRGVDLDLPTPGGVGGAATQSLGQIETHMLSLSSETAVGNQRRAAQLDAVIERIGALQAEMAEQRRVLTLLVSSRPEAAVAG